ncbi:MAG: hypothetical protein AAGG75_23020 [Bacteroidota bacterium]
MKELNPEYQQQLDQMIQDIQATEEFQRFLDEEEEEDYQTIRETFEPRIAELYEEVTNNNPLQLLAFEKAMLDPNLEGLFLPRILGYAVLRGVTDDNYKYMRPQQHFKDILMAICNSSNFDFIRKRIGQTIQMGFALSSDIWITNLINVIENKRIRYFLQGQKLPKYRDLKERRIGYARYKNQFKQDDFYTTVFPTTKSELKVLYPSVRQFMRHRVTVGKDNSSILKEIRAFLDNEDFKGSPEYIEFLCLYANFFDVNEADHKHLTDILHTARKDETFSEKWLENILAIHNSSDLNLDGTADKRVSALLHHGVKDELSNYYDLTDIIHSKGYLHDDTIEATKVFYNAHEGLSTVNECLRKTIFNYFAQFLKNIGISEYPEYFELSKIFPVYLGIFSNQQFNQNLKELCMAYIRKLLKRYTDKRGKDYQDIKKFVSTNFLDLGFLKQKEIVELFKTRRKKKKPVS